MKHLLRGKAPAPPTLAPVSADAVAAAIGGTAEELVDTYVQAGIDFMGRPVLAAEAARRAYEEWANRETSDMLRIRYERYQEDWSKRRKACAEAATAAAREAYVGGNRGGEESGRFMTAQWQAEREALAVFDEQNPQITITEFREQKR